MAFNPEFMGYDNSDFFSAKIVVGTSKPFLLQWLLFRGHSLVFGGGGIRTCFSSWLWPFRKLRLRPCHGSLHRPPYWLSPAYPTGVPGREFSKCPDWDDQIMQTSGNLKWFCPSFLLIPDVLQEIKRNTTSCSLGLLMFLDEGEFWLDGWYLSAGSPTTPFSVY